MKMRPAEVGSVGDDLVRMAEEAKAKIASLFTSSDVAVHSNPGWAFSESLAACRTAWERRMVDTVDRTAMIGQGLVEAAATATALDAEAARRVHAVLDDFGDP